MLTQYNPNDFDNRMLLFRPFSFPHFFLLSLLLHVLVVIMSEPNEASPSPKPGWSGKELIKDLDEEIEEPVEERNEEVGEDGDDEATEEEDETTSDSEKFIQELLQLKYQGGSPSSAGPGQSLPPKQRIRLYQPRTKLEQFEDILMESQLLESQLPDLRMDFDKLELSGDLDTMLFQDYAMLGMDFDTSDAIFNEAATTPTTNSNSSSSNGGGERDSGERRNSSETSSSNCNCQSCTDRAALEAHQNEEVQRLRQSWKEVRVEMCQFFRSQSRD